jgi:hypothetical protein
MLPRILYLLEKEIDSLKAVILGGACTELQYKVAIAQMQAFELAIEIAKKVETSSDEEEFENDFES